jgi:ABC-type multidrug transport system fused ATPase/permease subunit
VWALWEQHWSGRCAIRTVKLSNAEACETEAISEQARGAYQAGVRVAKLQAVVEPASAVALQGSFVLVLGIGGARLASGAITLGDLVAFLLYLLYLSFPLVLVFTSVTDLQQGMAAVARIKEVLAAPPEPATIVAPRERFEAPRSEAPAVRFDSVTFGYGPPSIVGSFVRGPAVQPYRPGGLVWGRQVHGLRPARKVLRGGLRRLLARRG